MAKSEPRKLCHQSFKPTSNVYNASKILGRREYSYVVFLALGSRAILTLEALYPFHCNEAGDFWTSKTVRDHTIFGYTYPELMDLSDNITLVRRVNALYGQNATSQYSWDLTPIPAPVHSSCMSKISSSKANNSTTASTGVNISTIMTNNGATITIQDSIASPTAIPSGGYTTQTHAHHRHQHSAQRSDFHYYYFVNVRVTKGGPDAASKVYVYLDAAPATGEVSTDSRRQLSGPGFVGFTGFQSMGSDVSKAMQDDDAKIMGVVALTEALEEEARQGHLASMDEATVAAYLQEKMTWQIVVVSAMSCL
jgi:tyrosinase